jgi:hypothetical protein
LVGVSLTRTSITIAGPFCHRALLTLVEKKVPYTTTLIDFDNKPQWLLDVNPAGSVPVMKVCPVIFYEFQFALHRTTPKLLLGSCPMQCSLHCTVAGFLLATAHRLGSDYAPPQQ